MKKILFATLILILCAALAAAVFRFSTSREAGRPHGIRVMTTLFPLYDMARYVANGKADVSLLLPPGVEAHSFEPKPSDIVKVSEGDIFIYTGRFMEPWAEDIVRSVRNRSLIVVDTSRGTRMVPSVFSDTEKPAGTPDPHIWLDFDNARIMVKTIAAAFIARDPADRKLFEQRAEEYCAKLAEMDAAYRNTLSDCRTRELVYGGHYAFGYLAHRYGLRYLAAQGVSPDSEPTASDLARLVEQIRKDRIPCVFYEELTSPKISETIARETNARMLLLSAGHNVTREQFKNGITFFDILRKNLENLKTGLGCK